MLDRDLVELYDVKNIRLREQVKEICISAFAIQVKKSASICEISGNQKSEKAKDIPRITVINAE